MEPLGPPGTWSWEKIIQPGPLGKDVWHNEHRVKLQKQQKRRVVQEIYGGSDTELAVDSESDAAENSDFKYSYGEPDTRKSMKATPAM